MQRQLTVLALIGLATVASAEDLPPSIRVAAENHRDAAAASRQAADIGRSLADHVGPRLVGSPGERAAEDWALETLKRSFGRIPKEKRREAE